MCLRIGVGCCFGFGGHGTEDDHFGNAPTKGGHQYHTGAHTKTGVAATPNYAAASVGVAADRNGLQGAAGQHANGYKAPPYDHQKIPAAVEQGHKASNDVWSNWPAAGTGPVGQERAYVHSGAKGTLQTQPAMNAMVAAEGAAYSNLNYGRLPAHGQYYYQYN